MPPYANYQMGALGVDVDSSPIHANPSSLLKAQNAVLNVLGVDGGIVNRPGLVKFSGAGAGSVLGGTPVPLFNYSDTRTLLLAQINSSAGAWVTTANLFAASSVTAAIGAWRLSSVYFSTGTGVCRMGVFFNGTLYYASSDYTVGTTSPVIRIYNGSDDRELCKVLPATVKGITGMWVTKGVMYVLTLDSGTSDADFIGSVYKLSANGHLERQGDALPTGYVPTTIIMHNDKLYVGGSRLTTTNEAKIFSLDPLSATTAWATDATLDADDYMVTGMATFQGLLYATTKNGGASTKGKILKRALAGTWSTSDSTVNNTGTFEDIVAWEDALYASSRSYDVTTNTAVVRKSTDGTSWSTVYNSATATGPGIFTISGLRLFTMGTTALLHTVDGASWTSATPAGDGSIDGVLGTLVLTQVPGFEEPVGDLNTPTVNVTNVSTVGLSSTDLPTGSLAMKTVTLTIAEFRALNTTPKELVAAPGSGKMVIPWMGLWEQNATSSSFGSPSLNMQYAGVATNLMSSWSYVESVYNVIGVYSLGSSIGTGASRANKALNFTRGGGTLTGGTWTSDARITVWYSVVDAV